ncbi:fungal-specific transcription factor domain-containing protein [Biscogniauxia mediterranea]|nr:fungal-specific transcription factor domain-containing protein [Biscogniauxia mediterranea]
MMSTAGIDATNPKSKSAAKVRKRAPKACLSCRSRKVRCDVSQRGRPCMNCYLDNESCVVTGRASRYRKVQQDGQQAQASYPPYNSTDESSHARPAEDVVRSRLNGEPTSPRADFENDPVSRDKSNAMNDAATTSSTEAEMLESAQPPPPKSHTSHNQNFNRHFASMPIFNDTPASSVPPPNFNSFVSTELPLWVGDQRIAVNADVTYSYYPFITISNLHNIMPQDVNYLESQGCLRVPTRIILDEFVQQYFLHVHPLMPLINEGDFWDMYGDQRGGGSGEKISLLVFQAILFSSCNFVSKDNIKALGFPTIRAARATFYRRTKLLYDFDTEASLVCLSQTALLLSYWAPNWSHASKKPNTIWLGAAIQNAKSAEAHTYSAMPTFSSIMEPAQSKKQNVLKRLWWCCVIRDRILPLGMRRSLQITRDHFDMDTNPGLGYTDLADEVERSKVYNPETKRCLIEIFVQIGELCSILTDVLTLVFPLDDVPGWGRQFGPEAAAKVRECKMALRRWHKGASLRFPMFGGGSVPRKATGTGKHFQHDSVILYTNLMYMYYHSTRAALCHHEVLQLAVASASPNLNSNLREFSNIYENRHELQEASCGVTECLKELIQLRLARWLPISAVACTALPLVLHIIDVKLSWHNKNNGGSEDPNGSTALKQHRLNILIEAMKTYQPQYDGVDYISETIRHIINLAQLDPPSNPDAASTHSQGRNGVQPSISGWTDILASQPGTYLRLAMTMDLSLSKGRLAQESDFPISLRGLFSAGFSPIRSIVGQPVTAQQTTTSTTAAAAAACFPRNPGTVHSLSSSSSDSDSGSNSNSPTSLDGATTKCHHPRNSDNSTSTQRVMGEPAFGSDIDMSGSSGMFMHTGNASDVAHDDHNTTLDMNFDLHMSMDNLAGDVLAAYAALDAGENSKENGGLYDGRRGEEEGRAGGGGDEDDWIERAWSDEGMGKEGSVGVGSHGGASSGGEDRETERALLDALRAEGVSCAA